MYLARRLGEKAVKNSTSPFYSSECSVFSTSSSTYLIPSLSLVRVNMTSSTEDEHETFTSIPTWPCEWPEVVVRDSIVAPELGTQANPIVIGDDPAPLGSASNPIVIHVDEG